MILGMNLVAVIVASSATLIMLLEQRQSVRRLHDTTARQVQDAAQIALDDVQRALTAAAGESPDEAALARLKAGYPALRAVHTGPADGSEPTTRIAADAITLAVPLADGSGALIADLDPAALWQRAVAVPVGKKGYVYLVDESGAPLALPRSAERDPAGFSVIADARAGQSASRLYRGLAGGWVIGRAVPASGYTVVAETPLSEFVPTLVRLVALWLMALAITAFVGETLLRRILRAVLAPLDILSQGAQRVGAGDYGSRIRLPSGTERELIDLARAFNDMTHRLQESQRQIDAYTHEMEDIVDLRARELSRKALQLEVAADVSHKIATIRDPRALVREVVDLIRGRFEVYHVEILLVDDDTGAILPGDDSRAALASLTLHDSERSVIAWTARHGHTLYVPDVTQEPRYRRDPALPASRCELAIPLRFGERVIGVLNLESAHANAFPRDEIAVLESLANEIAVSLHNAQVFAALETANRELAQASLQAKQANTLKSRFLFNASHKLRTPLNAIIGYSETMLSGVYGDLPSLVLDRQRRVLENGRSLQALVEDMLDLSAIETGQMTLNLLWFNPEPLLGEVMNAARALHQTGYADHTLALRLELHNQPLPPVWADVDRLRYILINLMSNAIKFTPDGEIIMTAGVADDHVVIQVQDTGPGIAEDDLRYIFEPFQHQRGATEAEGKGTGLGLPVSRLLALRQGGDLTVESRLHQGSTFTLRLPCRPDGAPPPPARVP